MPTTQEDATNAEELLLLPIPPPLTLSSHPTALTDPAYFLGNQMHPWDDPFLRPASPSGETLQSAQSSLEHLPSISDSVENYPAFRPSLFYSVNGGPRRFMAAAGIQQPKKPSVNAPRTPLGHPSQGLYEATYSNIEVYEFTYNDVAIMRRKSDGWINGTHILKAAGVEKGKRTKILEKEVHGEEHEKIQGGYGRYQGTW